MDEDSGLWLRRRRRRLGGLMLLVVAVLGVAIVAASSDSPAAQSADSLPVKIVTVPQPVFTDDPNPPPIPTEKAEFAKNSLDLPRDVVAGTLPAEDQDHDDEESEPAGPPKFSDDPDTWQCQTPDGVGVGISAHAPTLQVLEKSRDWLISERKMDPDFVPTVHIDSVPAGCEPLDGFPTIEEFFLARSVFVVMNDDGSVKDLDQIRAEFER